MYKEYPKGKKAQIERMNGVDVQLCWECPCCEERFSQDCVTEEEFAEYLYSEGVRRVEMDMMEGMFCQNCYTDPEIQESTL